MIFGKMHQYEVPYEPAHWLRMEAMLNEWFTWPQYVLRYKTMELALFLLLFITCWQYLPKLGRQVQQQPANGKRVARTGQRSPWTSFNRREKPSLGSHAPAFGFRTPEEPTLQYHGRDFRVAGLFPHEPCGCNGRRPSVRFGCLCLASGIAL